MAKTRSRVQHRHALRLRLATRADVATLLAMMADFNRSEGISFRRPALERALLRLLRDPSVGFVGLFVESGKPIGYGVLTYGFDLEWGGRDALLTEIYVVPERRRHGLAAAGLRLLEKRAQAGGAKAVSLAVRPENAAAMSLYRREGYGGPTRLLLSKPLPR
jgi:ribosomal protein S18 acetylase RimI-like enzyme